MPKVPLTNKPGVTNWVERYNALPKGSWIRRAAEQLKGKGHPENRAIPIAVKAAEKLCSTGDLNFPGLQQADSKSKAEACAAVVAWKTAAARAKADMSVPAMIAFNTIDLSRVHLHGGWLSVREPDRQTVFDLTTEQLTGIG